MQGFKDNKIFCFLELEVLNIRREQISKGKSNIGSRRPSELPSSNSRKPGDMCRLWYWTCFLIFIVNTKKCNVTHLPLFTTLIV